MVGARRLVVEVVAAQGLSPEDGEAIANVYCVLDFGGQRKRTRVIPKDLNLAWNEKFEFSLLEYTSPKAGVAGDLEISVQNEHMSGAGRRTSFLGRLQIPMNNLAAHADTTTWYPLQKRGLSSNSKGELGLRVWLDLSGTNDENSTAMIPMEPRTRRVAKADNAPQGMRSNLVTMPDAEFAVRETNPHLGWAVDARQHYDLVEEMTYLFVKVVRARNLRAKDSNGLSDPYVKIELGPVKVVSRTIPNTLNPEWNQTFAIGRDKARAPKLELSIWDADKLSKDDFLGGFMINVQDLGLRKPPESPVAPQWYGLESKTGKGRVRGEIMIAIWWGTQADEAFPDAWQSDTGWQAQFRSKVYLTPKLWYLRVKVIEAQNIGVHSMPYVRVEIRPFQSLRTSRSVSQGGSPFWDEDLMFVAAEPFDDMLSLYLEDSVGDGKVEILGVKHIPLNSIERRIDGRPVAFRWYSLEKEGAHIGAIEAKLHLCLCFEGGYHVMDESPHFISDTRPTANQLWKLSLGVLEVGIHGATNLIPKKTSKDGRGTIDAYCIAKYGPKWVRTRTIFDSVNPRWNEQYTWEVFDPCTVITLGIFDNRNTSPMGPAPPSTPDFPIGKVRIRLSTLESDRVYTNAYPLLVVTPQGIKKTGMLELAVRLSSASATNLMKAYFRPELPTMHYFSPLNPMLEDWLRVATTKVVALRLNRTEPPLKQEVIFFMLDRGSEGWSMRRSKAIYYRIMAVLSDVLSTLSWFFGICSWRSPATTVLVHVLFLTLVVYPELLLPTAFFYLFLLGAWNYRKRPRTPPFMDAKMSQGAIGGHYLDELEEELNITPVNNAQEVLKIRYERLRGLASRVQSALGDLASIGERAHLLLSWRDPRATFIFITFCLVAAIVLYLTPLQVILVLFGVYVMRHPRFRGPFPSLPFNFFKRLPSETDRIL